MLNILSKLANAIKSPNFDHFLEKVEQAADERERGRKLAKALHQAKSVIRAKRKSTYC